jgi:hypothetical protein
MAKIIDLQDLVDSPMETLAVEYKQWLDLTDSVNRANLARHIAAIANYGGGYIVFGIKDDMTPDAMLPTTLHGYSHDVVSSIVKKFLTPAPHCDVILVKSAKSGHTHPIILVPSHGNVPICSLRGGPDDKVTKKPQGIAQGIYYTRDTGPESTPVTGPEHWRPIINRCVLAERETLLKSFTHILSGQALDGKEPENAPSLRDWHESSRRYFMDHVIHATSGKEWPIPINVANFQYSYRILHEDDTKVKTKEFLTVIRQVVRLRAELTHSV